MKLHSIILVLACVLGSALDTRLALAQFQQLSGNYSVLAGDVSERHSPHFYTVRNILRNHRSLQPASSSAGSALLPGTSISTSEAELESDVVFERGAYEFHLRLQDNVFKVKLRKTDGEWLLEIHDEFDGSVLGAYVLKR